MKVIEKADVAPIEPLLCSIEAGTAIIGRSKRFIIDAIARGQLRAVKSDRRTLLVVQSLKDYVAGLPRRGPAASATANGWLDQCRASTSEHATIFASDARRGSILNGLYVPTGIRCSPGQG